MPAASSRRGGEDWREVTKWPVEAPFGRIIVVNDQLNDLDETAEENRAYEVSDEMLESEAGMEMGKPKAYIIPSLVPIYI